MLRRSQPQQRYRKLVSAILFLALVHTFKRCTTISPFSQNEGHHYSTKKLKRILRTQVVTEKTEFQDLKVPAVLVPLKQGQSPQCSCLNALAGQECCKRRLHQAHKMGTVLTNRMFAKYPDVRVVRRDYLSVNTPGLSTMDYRDVLLVRNIYEALASGYLYHLSGRECWLNPMGKPWNRHKKTTWTKNVLKPYIPDPPAGNRSLCEYLAEESEEAGMAAYMGWVMKYHYGGLPGHWDVAQRQTEAGRTLVLCFEDLTNPNVDKTALDTMINFLYPGTHTKWRGERTAGYTGSHGTSHNNDARSRLRTLVKELDSAYFGGWVERFDTMYPCRSFATTIE